MTPAMPALAQTATGTTPPATTQTDTDVATQNDQNLGDIVVTGTTSRDRPLISASADITYANRDAIDRLAPRSTADM
ncbi:hypothetical protein, partial [Clostridium perfringens]